CTECEGSRLGILGREVTIYGKTIIDTTKFSLNELLAWLYALDEHVPEDDLKVLRAFSEALKKRISNLIEVGLEYLSLDRPLPSLSAGESQRVRLASLLGSGLTGVLYVLDEPTTGLHPRDNTKLLKTLRKIQEAGNTVLIIEHDMDMVKHADYVLDIGPEGGSKGGEIVASGPPLEIIKSTKSVTGRYLTKKIEINENASIQNP